MTCLQPYLADALATETMSAERAAIHAVPDRKFGYIPKATALHRNFGNSTFQTDVESISVHNHCEEHTNPASCDQLFNLNYSSEDSATERQKRVVRLDLC